MSNNKRYKIKKIISGFPLSPVCSRQAGMTILILV